MEITKHNICEVIESYLKEQKIRYTIIEQDSLGCLYELHISSIEPLIQVEYNLLDDEESNDVVVQFFIDINDATFYQSGWDNLDEESDSIESELEALIDKGKRMSQGISKISTKIEQIEDICNEYQLNFEDFIEVLYDI